VDSAESLHYKGKIALFNIKLETVSSKEKNQFPFTLQTTEKTYLIAANEEEERESWLKAIEKEASLINTRVNDIVIQE